MNAHKFFKVIAIMSSVICTLSLISCAKKSATNDVNKSVQKSQKSNLKNIKATSIRIIDGEDVSMKGGYMIDSYGRPIPLAPCIIIIKSISPTRRAAAEKIGVKSGNAYMQIVQDNNPSNKSLADLPSELWLIKSIEPTMKDKQLFNEFSGMMQNTP